MSWDKNPTSNDLFVEFIHQKTVFDNSYGANAIGWGASAHSGKNHKFQELIGSDDAQFVFTDDDGNTVLDITVDYLHGFGYKPDGKPDKNLPPFRSGGVTDGDGKVNSGSKLDVLAAATSLQYNWDTFGDTHPELFGKDSDSPAADENYNVDDPSLSNWVFEVIYEVRVDGNLFDTNGFGGVAIPLVHDSPNKIGKNKVWPEIGEPIPDPIPEPTTIVSIKSASSNFWNSVKLSTLGNSPTASIWILLAKSDLSTLNSQSKQK